MDYKYLLKVDPGYNNNKFYEMQQTNDSTFVAYYGRVDHTRQNKTYPMGKWNSIYNSKVKKGYQDVTNYHATSISSASSTVVNHESAIIQDIFQHIQNYSNARFNTTYNVKSTNAVTPLMIDDSQDKLNLLITTIDNQDWNKFNTILQDLFYIIPRRMDGLVGSYLLSKNATVENAKELLSNEQALLDMVRGQVVTNQTATNPQEVMDLFEMLGITVDECEGSEISNIKHKLGEISNRFHSAVKINHKDSLSKFEKNNITLVNNLTLEWHGSRTENWLSILKSGLVLYPTSAHITGKMFGSGLYMAPKAKKSLGYTSVKDAYWTKGSDNYGYLALFDINLGRTLEVKRWNSLYKTFNKRIIQERGHDSLYAYGGYDLYNDEIVIYDEAQCTIKYLVRLK